MKQATRVGRMKALIVDDSKAARMLMSRMLKSLGFDVVEAANGQEGLDRLQECEDISFVVLDWIMPVMGGLEFIRELRSQARYGSLPVLMVTTQTKRDGVVEALEAGVDEYLMKPFDVHAVRQKLELLNLV